MRLAFVVPRYGQEIVGGAESAARAFAERLAARGHEVAVLTSTSRTLDWEDALPRGEETDNGVTVVRLRPVGPRAPGFAHRFARLVATGRASEAEEEEFLAAQGPVLEGLSSALAACQPERVMVYPLLYWPGIEVLRRVPERIVLHPAAHPEPILKLGSYRGALARSRRIVFQSRAEEALVRRIARIGTARTICLPLGVEVTTARSEAASPVVVALGRVTRDKGAMLLNELWRRARPELALRFIGPVAEPLDPAPGVELGGVLPVRARDQEVARAVAVMVMSRYESFSLAAAEAMAIGVPVIANGHNPVLAELVERSGAGLVVRRAEEVLAAASLLAGDPALRAALGDRGRRFAAAELDWERILDRYEGFIGAAGRRSR